MAKKSVEIQGITTTAGNNDGECLSLVNLRKKNGMMMPVSTAGEETNIPFHSNPNIVFLHHVEEGDNYISIRYVAHPPQVRIIWNNGVNEGNDDYTNIFTFGTETQIYSIEQIGNSLVFATSLGFRYALWKNGTYLWLGEIPKMEPIINNAYLAETSPFIRDFPPDTDTDILTNTQKQKENIEAAINNCINEYQTPKNHLALYDHYLIKYAFKLYDGSYINITEPIIIYYESTLGTPPPNHGLPVNPFPPNSGLTFFSPLPLSDSIWVYLFPFKIKFSTNLNYLNDWKDVITGVEVFMSMPIGIYSMDKIQSSQNNEQPYWVNKWGIRFNMEEYEKNVLNIIEFYKIKEFDLYAAGEQTLIFPEASDNIPNIDALVNKNLLLGNVKTENIVAKNTHTFNKRLHAWNIEYYTKTISNINFSILQSDDDWNFEVWGAGHVTLPMELRINRGILIEIDIKPENSNETITLQRYTDIIPFYSSSSSTQNEFEMVKISPFITYPSKNAFHIRIYVFKPAPNNNARLLLDAPLKKHPYLDYSYHLRFFALMERDALPIISKERITNDRILDRTESDRLIVSEVANALSFPEKNIYEFDGKILFLGTNRLAVSDRNYGTQPLFVFTENGIFTLQQGDAADVPYSNVINSTIRILPVNDKHCETPYGVCYVSNRGVFMVNNEGITFLSPQLEEKQLPTTLPLPAGSEERLDLSFTNFDFIDYAEECDNLIYETQENELIVHKKGSPYNFCYNFDSKMWYQRVENIELVVKNSYTDTLFTLGNVVKNFSKTDEQHSNIQMILRPLKFGIDEVKNLLRLIFRGRFINVQFAPSTTIPANVLLFASNDEFNNKLLRGMKLKSPLTPTGENNYKDFDMGLFAKSKFRNYLPAMRMQLHKDTRIGKIDFEVSDNYKNDKMR